MQKDYVSFERKLMRINAWDKVDKKKYAREKEGRRGKNITRTDTWFPTRGFKYSSRSSADLFSFKLLLV